MHHSKNIWLLILFASRFDNIWSEYLSKNLSCLFICLYYCLRLDLDYHSTLQWLKRSFEKYEKCVALSRYYAEKMLFLSNKIETNNNTIECCVEIFDTTLQWLKRSIEKYEKCVALSRYYAEQNVIFI